MEPSAETLGKTGSAVEHDFLTLLPELARRIRSHGDHNARQHRMTWPQLMIVRRLERQPGLSQNELAAVVGVAPVTVARLIDRVEALDLVKRHEDPTDRRIWRLRVTPAAASALRDSECYQAELDELIIKGVDSAVLDLMIVGLRKMKANLSSGLRLPRPRWPKQQVRRQTATLSPNNLDGWFG
jgi:MarR family transcriptional regulator, transcriptional regulator for hemolysin